MLRRAMAKQIAKPNAAPPPAADGNHGWIEHTCEKSGSPYWHHNRRGTTWFRPGGWEKHNDGSGRTYYHHAETGTTQWDQPICMK